MQKIFGYILSPIGSALTAFAFVASVLAWAHHSGAESESEKIQKNTAAIVLKVQEKKNEISSQDHSDITSARRVLAGTY